MGGNKTLTVNEKINEVMVMGDFVNSIIFSRAEQEIKPNQLMTKKSINADNDFALVCSCQIIENNKIYVSCLSKSNEGVNAIFYR